MEEQNFNPIRWQNSYILLQEFQARLHRLFKSFIAVLEITIVPMSSALHKRKPGIHAQRLQLLAASLRKLHAYQNIFRPMKEERRREILRQAALHGDRVVRVI